MPDLEDVSKEEIIQEYVVSRSVVESLSLENNELRSLADDQAKLNKDMKPTIETMNEEYIILLEKIKAARKKQFDKSSENRTLNQLNLFEENLYIKEY